MGLLIFGSVMSLKLIVLTTAVLFGRDVVRTNQEVGTWTSTETWADGVVPDRDDRVLIPGSRDQSALVRVESGDEAKASAVMIGWLRNSTGQFEIFGRLDQPATKVEGESHSGRMLVGGPESSGTVTQHPGSSVTVSKALRIAWDPDSIGRYTVANAALRARQTLSLARHHTSTATFEVLGSTASVQTHALLVGRGKCMLRFVSDAEGFSPIEVTKRAQLGGTLHIRVSDLTPLASRFKVINLSKSATLSGGFRRVFIESPAGSHYELSYDGGNNNDVLLHRQRVPLVRFEDWIETIRPRATKPEHAFALADGDRDNLSNLGEYKLGCDPFRHEGAVLERGIDDNGDPYAEYVHRTDRQDVTVTPLQSLDGRVWSSSGLVIESRDVIGQSEIVRVTAPGSPADVHFDLNFERVPDPGVKPNILFISVDDLNDWIEPLGGHPQSITPNLNRLAARGTLFTNAHAPGVICNVSRTAILTGIGASTSGVYGNNDEFRDSPVLANVRTIPQHFVANGYTAYGSGKIFHRATSDAWSDYFPTTGDNRPQDPWPPEPLSGVEGLERQFDWGPLEVPGSRMGDHKVASWLVGKLRAEPGDGPRFVGCGIFRPHLPLHVPTDYFNSWRESDVTLPVVLEDDLADVPTEALNRSIRVGDHAAITDAGRWRSAVHAYLAAVKFADKQVGRVVNALDNSTLGRNTIIVLFSDHGFLLGQKEGWRKNSLWEESTRVPLIIIAPGLTQPGTRCDAVVSLLDLYPTLVDLAQLPDPGGLEGRSLLPQLVDPAEARDEPVLITRSRYRHSLRTTDWRFSLYSDGSEELYDHSVDPREWTNLAGDPAYDEVRERLLPYFPDRPAPGVKNR